MNQIAEQIAQTEICPDIKTRKYKVKLYDYCHEPMEGDPEWLYFEIDYDNRIIVFNSSFYPYFLNGQRCDINIAFDETVGNKGYSLSIQFKEPEKFFINWVEIIDGGVETYGVSFTRYQLTDNVTSEKKVLVNRAIPAGLKEWDPQKTIFVTCREVDGKEDEYEEIEQ